MEDEEDEEGTDEERREDADGSHHFIEEKGIQKNFMSTAPINFKSMAFKGAG